ncbi:hypothetical protein G9A89_022592 [Geosiphon pyriformis]|nr:hypothetical protein G9A89_022592 [Geosiphon pyriformis]
MKKSAKSFSADTVSKDIASRKKRKSGVLKDGAAQKIVVSDKAVGSSWGSETGDTTESDSVDMKEEFLIEKTSVDYGEGDFLEGKNVNQTPKESKMVTKQALGKPLGKINFLGNNDDDDILSGGHLELPPSLKNLVNVSVRKLFALDIGLEKVTGKSFQEKLSAVRKLFLGINGFRRASILSKFAGIIRAIFTSELSLAQTSKKTGDAKILVNTDLKKPTGRSDQTVVVKEIPVGTSVEAVHTALSEFGFVVLIKIQLVGLWQKTVVEFAQLDQANLVTARWSILIGKDAGFALHTAMGTNAHNIWDFIGSVSGKTCVIDQHPITYAQTRCVIVCFDSAASINAVMETTSVLKSTNLCWTHLSSAKYAKCKNLSYTSLDCSVGEKTFSSELAHRILSENNKNRLASIYARCFAPISCPMFFGGVLWANIVGGSSFPPLSVRDNLTSSGFSSEMKPTPLVSVELNDRFATLERSLASLVEHVDKLAKRLDSPEPMVSQPSPRYQPLVTLLSQNQGVNIVMSESSGVVTGSKTIAKVVVFDSSVVSKMEETLCNLSVTLVWKIATCNAHGINVSAKQKDIVCWHIDSENMVFIVTETKFLGAGVIIIVNNSLAHHVSKVEEVPGCFFSVQLLFKDKLSVVILGLYVGASAETRFGQACEINSFIAKTANSFTFMVLGGDFNEDGSRKSASLKFCSDLGLVNSFSGHPLSLSSALAGHEITSVSDFFNTNHNAVLVSVGLSGLLDFCLNDIGLESDAACFFKVWSNLDNKRASKACTMFDDNENRGLMIKSILNRPFKKVVLDHLILDDELILKPKEVKSAIKKRVVPVSLPVHWSNQYAPLDHVSDDAFSKIMNMIELDEFLLVVKELSNGKAAGISGIPNKLWKHGDVQVLSSLLNILNVCLNCHSYQLRSQEDGLSNSSLAKAYSDIKFFLNVVLRKTITEKQFLYLVSAVLQSIISYRLQFSCISKSVCKKWDKILKKELKLKTNLLKDFPNEALYHLELYSLRTFKQVLAENILAGLVVFANAGGILGKLFEHRAMELQATSWMLWHPLRVPINLLIDLTNCFLAGVTRVLKLCNLSLGGDLPDVFRAKNSITVLDVLGLESYLCVAKSLRRWKKLDLRGPVPVWFVLLVEFINGSGLSNHVVLSHCSALADSPYDFGYINEHLLNSDLSSVTVYTDGSVKGLDSLNAHGGAATYFLDANVSIGVKIDGLLSLTLVELQVIALALECVPVSQSVNLFTDSQASLDLCEFGGGLSVTWNKVKSHSGVVGNEYANFYTDAAVASKFFLPLVVPYRFLRIEDRPVSRNACHIAKKLFNAVHSVGWKAKCVGSFVSTGLCDHFDKIKTFCVWHSDGKIKSDYTNSASVTLWSYLMKALHYHLPVAKRKRLYNLRYPSIVCIWCGLVEDSDHVFSYTHDANAGSSINLFTALAKGFVLKGWVVDMVSHLGAGFGGSTLVVNFIHHFAESHRSAIWIPAAKLRSYYEKHNLLSQDGSFFSSVSGLSSLWSAGSIRDFGFKLGVHMCFRLHPCLTKSDFGFLSGFPVAEILDA